MFIERLEIDAGTLNLEDFERGFAAAVAVAMGKQLGKQLPPAVSSAWHSSSGIQHKTEQQSVHEAFIHFLKTGILPWWFNLPAGKSLEQVMLDSWQQVSQVFIAPKHYVSLMHDVLSSATVRTRLVQQFSTVFLESLYASISPEGLMNVVEVARTLDHANLAGAELKILHRLLWQTAFAQLAEGKAQTTWALATPIRHALQQSRLQVPALTLLLKRLSQESGSSFSSDFQEPTVQDISLPEKLRQNGNAKRTAQEASPNIVKPGSRDDARNKKSQRIRPAIAATPRSATSDADRTIREEPKKSDQPTQSRVTRIDQSQRSSIANSATVRPAASNAKRSVQDERGNIGKPTLQQVHQLKEQQKNNLKKAATVRPALNGADHGLQSVPVKAAQAPPINMKEGVYVNCAGVVLLHPFLPHFFQALGIAAEGRLLQPERALCLLHFLATGQAIAPEYDLLLPKLLCNVPVDQPVEADVNLTAAEFDEATALLDAVIKHWDVLGNTSVDGLRGTFLVRSGKLSRRDDGDWLLQVEAQSFDILLDQLTWGFRMIQLPWMEKMLWVEWR